VRRGPDGDGGGQGGGDMDLTAEEWCGMDPMAYTSAVAMAWTQR
jgi:hypothetical protein